MTDLLKVSILVLLVVIFSKSAEMSSDLSNVNANSNVNELWELYKVEHNKTFADQAEENKRFQIFVDTIKTIIAHNDKFAAKQVTYSMGINQFSDRLPEEMPGYRKH